MYNIIEASAAVAKRLGCPIHEVTAIQQEDGSGLCWNYQKEGSNKWEFCRLTANVVKTEPVDDGLTTTMLICTKEHQYITERDVIFLAGSCRIFYTHKDGEMKRNDGMVEEDIVDIISIEIHKYQ